MLVPLFVRARHSPPRGLQHLAGAPTLVGDTSTLSSAEGLRGREQVGVDVNTASPALLQYVAGLNAKSAGNIVKVRETQGPFRSRQQLLAVPGIGPKTFEQVWTVPCKSVCWPELSIVLDTFFWYMCQKASVFKGCRVVKVISPETSRTMRWGFTQAAGFLRVYGGDDVLDSTSVHPECYCVAKVGWGDGVRRGGWGECKWDAGIGRRNGGSVCVCVKGFGLEYGLGGAGAWFRWMGGG